MDLDYWKVRKIELQKRIREKEDKIKEWSNEIENLKNQVVGITSKIDYLSREINELKKESKSFRDEYDSIVRNEKAKSTEHKVAEQIMKNQQEELFLAVVKAITIPNQSVFSISQKARIIKNPEDYVVISKSEFKDILKEVQKSEEFEEICTTERKYGIDIICLKGRSEYVHRNVDVFDGKYVIPVVNYITKLGKESIHNLTLNINRANK